MNNVPAAATLLSTSPDAEGRNFSKAKKMNGMADTAIACSTSHMKRLSGAVDMGDTPAVYLDISLAAEGLVETM
jgi:hypothetical protein